MMPEPYYDDGTVTLYHGDSRDVLPQLDIAADLLLTDPPYGMQFASFGGTAQEANIAADAVRQGVRVLRQTLFEVAPRLAPDAHLLMFCHWQGWPDFYDAASAYMKIRNALIWHKKAGGMGSIRLDYIRDYEVILYGTRGDREILGDGSFSNVLQGFSRPGRERVHPTEKPLALLQHLITRHCPPGGLVLDPFAGGGTSLVAARNMGRRAVGIELDEGYCEATVRRLDQGVLDVAA